MLFYCESKNEKSVILDIHLLENFKLWWERLEVGEWVENDLRSLIEINELRTVKYRGFREGLWYEIPDFFWKSFKFDTTIYSFYQEDRLATI